MLLGVRKLYCFYCSNVVKVFTEDLILIGNIWFKILLAVHLREGSCGRCKQCITFHCHSLSLLPAVFVPM